MTRYIIMCWSPPAILGKEGVSRRKSSRGTPALFGAGSTRQTTVSPVWLIEIPSEKFTIVFPTTLYAPVAVPAGTVIGTE